MRTSGYRPSQNVEDRRPLGARFQVPPGNDYARMRELGSPIQAMLNLAANSADLPSAPVGMATNGGVADEMMPAMAPRGPVAPPAGQMPAWPGRYPINRPPSGLTTADISQGLYPEDPAASAMRLRQLYERAR